MTEYWKDITTPQFEGEIWKDVPGFEGEYMASSYGRVKSLDRIILTNCKEIHNKGEHIIVTSSGHVCRKKGQILKQSKRSEYFKVCFGKKCFSVHKLVMLTFIGERPEGKVIDHINGIHTDNRLENLRYCTIYENNNNPNSDNVRPILQYTMSGEFICKWDSMTKACVGLGIKSHGISDVCRGKKPSAGGYQWKYYNANKPIPQKIAELKPQKKAILQHTLNGDFVKKFDSITCAVKELGINVNQISQCLRAKRNSAGGFKWQYA